MRLAKVFKALLVVAPKNHTRYYLNAIHIEHQGDKCVIEATDEAMALRVSVPTAWFDGVLDGVGDRLLVSRESLAAAMADEYACRKFDYFERPAHMTVYCGLKLDIIDANFPKLNLAKPRPDGTHSVQVDTDRLAILLEAVSTLREGCPRNVSRLAVGGNVGLMGHVDNVDYVAFLAPASR